jgi:hypothetical protein
MKQPIAGICEAISRSACRPIVAVASGGSSAAAEYLANLHTHFSGYRRVSESRNDLLDPDLDAPEVAMVLLAVNEDVVAEGLEARRGLPHVLRHLDPFADLVLALVEKIFGGTPRAHLLSFQHAVGAIANPPNVTPGFAFPKAPHWFPFSRHRYPSETKIAKYHQKYHQHILDMKKPLGLRGFGLRKPFIL